MEWVDILCLANSRKHAGRCVAGLRADGGGWLRPVSDRPDGSLFPRHYWLDADSEPALLDLISVPLQRAEPVPHQPENWIVGEGMWKLLERPASLDKVRQLLNTHRATSPLLFGGPEARVPFEVLKRAPAAASLAVVQPYGVWLRVTTSTTGRRQLRARFDIFGAYYDLPVTDPAWEQETQDVSYGDHPVNSQTGQLWLTLSLGEPTDFDGQCYKLVAARFLVPAGAS